jgi:hypothetical protein
LLAFFRLPTHSPLAAGRAGSRNEKYSLEFGIDLIQVVTTVWRTKTGTMLSIGLELQHHCPIGLLPLLAAIHRMPWPDQGKFLHRMEPQRGRLALQ